MQFNSFIFILCFLPLTLVGYYGFHYLGKDKLAKLYLLAMSLWFYGYFNASYLLIICTSIVVNFFLSRRMYVEDGKSQAYRKPLLILGIIFNIALIFYFKYFNFFLDNLNHAFNADFVLRNITLPLGISFFTFQQISYMVDSYKGETGDYTFLDYALFVCFFPQLVAGPIVLHSELISQFRDKSKWKVDYDNLTRGIMLFTKGLAKKVLIADVFGKAVDWGFAHAAVASGGENALAYYEVIVVMLSYTFQIYFDFSGYSDMATGLGAMFNFVIPINFNSPYKALSVADFWKRWHMTLTRFLTRYVYIPLGGNRKGAVRTYINVMIVFLISGIWHGANWTFILWGIIHGLGQCFNRMTSGIYNGITAKVKESRLGKPVMMLIKAVQWAVTFAFINIAWLLFRADSVTQWLEILNRLFVVKYYHIRPELLEFFRIPKMSYVFNALHINVPDNFVLFVGLYAFMGLAFALCLLFKNNYYRPVKRNVLSLVFTSCLLFVCIISLSTVSTFLYFNF